MPRKNTTRLEPAPRDWTPRRHGPHYCSPACGGWKLGVCTWAKFQSATRNADALSARLNRGKLKGWTPRVHENLGWHWSAMSACGRLYVTPNGPYSPRATRPHSYTAFLGEPFSHSGRYTGDAQTPEAAIRNVIAAAKADIAKIGALITTPLE